MAIVKFENYETFKGQFDRCMNATANNFVTIGYLLKQAKETDILKESGYSGMGEFAKTEYGLDESTTSRFIAICERYGNGEDRLIPEFEPFGYAKLSEMLTLPEHISEALTAEMTREEIREIKQEVKEEQAISPMEVMMEPENKEDKDTRIEILVLKEYLRYRPTEFKKIYELIGTEKQDIYQELADILAPQGLAMLIQRVSGHGKFMIKIDGIKNPVTFIDVRANENRVMEWEEFAHHISAVFDSFDIPAADQFKQIYGEEMKIEEAPVEEKKPERIKSEPKPPKAVEKTEKPSEKTEKTSEIPEESSTPEEKPVEDDFMNKPEEKKEEIAPAQSEAQSEDDSTAAGSEDITANYSEMFKLTKEIEDALNARNWINAYSGTVNLRIKIDQMMKWDAAKVKEALDSQFDNE